MTSEVSLAPVAEAERIETLDVLRGFAVLGILLLNILGFGLPSAAYSNPGFDVEPSLNADLVTWASVELLAEGAMRGLFSILFGAGVVLFTTGARSKSTALHYRRTFWLLVFGLVDAYLLLWNGDILVTYALAGAVLFWVRNVRATRLLATAAALIIVMSLFHVAVQSALGQAYAAAQAVERTPEGESPDPELAALALEWHAFVADYQPSEAAVEQELAQRRDSYGSAFAWNAAQTNAMLAFVVPLFLFWDALALMLIGMALYKLGVLQGQRSRVFYVRLMAIGFTIGLAVNGYEVARAIADDLGIFTVFAQMQPTYHVGRLGMAMGYLGLLVWITRRDTWPALRRTLACVGRMALTNYLMQSLICLVLFTGAGFALLGELSRAALYPVVLGIWIVQVIVSRLWLDRYRFGPVEWLWRALTYYTRPAFRRGDRLTQAA